MKENVLERNARLDTERKIADFRVKQQWFDTWGQDVEVTHWMPLPIAAGEVE